MRPRHLRSDQFFELQRAELVRLLQLEGMGSAAATLLAADLRRAIIQHAGGAKVYLASSDRDKAAVAQRVAALHADGRPAPSIAARLGLSLSHTYRLIAAAQPASEGQ